jgi:hypothetical protein
MAHLGITQVLPGAIANDKVNGRCTHMSLPSDRRNVLPVLLSTGIQRGMQDEGYILQGFHVHISFDSEAKNAGKTASILHHQPYVCLSQRGSTHSHHF